MLVLGAILIATGVIDTGSTKTVVRQPPLSMPSGEASSDPGDGLTVQQIYKRDSPGVVFISSKIVQRTTNPFGFPSEQQGSATGSGLRDRQERHILTNAHVVHGASKSPSASATARTRPTPRCSASTVHRPRPAQGRPAGADLHPLTLGDSSSRQVGDPAVAIGNPFGSRPHRHHGHRLGAPAPDHGARRLHDQQRHPDGRRDQPGQLRRPAARRRRQGDRDQLADRDRRRGPGQRRHRLRRADQHRQGASPAARAARARSQHAYLGVTTARRSPARTPGTLNLPVSEGALVAVGESGRARPTRRGSRRQRPGPSAGRWLVGGD